MKLQTALLIATVLSSANAFADEVIAESDSVVIFHNPDCELTSAFATLGNDTGCAAKLYSVEANGYYWGTCKINGKSYNIEKQGDYHLAPFRQLSWTQVGESGSSGGYWHLNGERIASCRDIYSLPEIDRNIYYKLENDTSEKGTLKVKVKLYRRMQ